MQKGVIYDQGYRRYEGAYRGRGYAIWSLLSADLKRALGIKKSLWYRAFLWFFLFVITVQTIFVFFFNFAAELGPQAPTAFRHPHSFLFDLMSIILLLLSAMVAPDLLSADRKFKVLPLYLVRPIELYDYLLAKAGAICGFLALTALIPQLGLFAAKTFTSEDALRYIISHAGDLGALWLSSAIYAVFYTLFAMAVSSLTTQRGLATGATIALLLLLIITKNQYFQLLDLDSLPTGLKNALFGVSYGQQEVQITFGDQSFSLVLLDWPVYLLAYGAIVAFSLSLLLFSYAKERP
jgi:ABC-2 type transport system permease protein